MYLSLTNRNSRNLSVHNKCVALHLGQVSILDRCLLQTDIHFSKFECTIFMALRKRVHVVLDIMVRSSSIINVRCLLPKSTGHQRKAANLSFPVLSTLSPPNRPFPTGSAFRPPDRPFPHRIGLFPGLSFLS